MALLSACDNEHTKGHSRCLANALGKLVLQSSTGTTLIPGFPFASTVGCKCLLTSLNCFCVWKLKNMSTRLTICEALQLIPLSKEKKEIKTLHAWIKKYKLLNTFLKDPEKWVFLLFVASCVHYLQHLLLWWSEQGYDMSTIKLAVGSNVFLSKLQGQLESSLAITVLYVKHGSGWWPARKGLLESIEWV